MRRDGAVGSVRAGGGCAARGWSGVAAFCGTWAPSRGVSGQSEGVCGAWGATRGAAWEVPHPPWICRVGMCWLWRLVVRVDWLFWVGVGPGGPFGVDVVARRMRFFVWGGRSLVVGGVVGRSTWWMVLAFYALVLLVRGVMWPGWSGWWAAVVVVVLVVVVVVGALVAQALVVVVVVLRVCPQDPLAFRWGLGFGHRLQPLGPYGLVGGGGGFGAGLNCDCRRPWWFAGAG